MYFKGNLSFSNISNTKCIFFRKRLYIVTVNIFKEYLIVTVTIFKKYLIVTLKKLKFKKKFLHPL